MKKKIEFKDLFESTASVLGWTLTWALMIFGWMAVGQPLTKMETQGRVHMQLEDLKSLISADSLNPSALVLSLRSSEKVKLVQKISRLQEAESLKIQNSEEEFQKSLLNLKNKRRGLQEKRLSTNNESADNESSKRIFESLLEEANLAALRDSKIEDIKEHSLVTISFINSDAGPKMIERIVAGQATLWTLSSSTAVAYNN